MIITVALDPCALGQTVHPVGAAAQRHFPERRQVLHRKKILHGSFRLRLFIDVPHLEPRYQLSRLNIHQFNLICIVKHRVGDALAHKHLGDGGDRIVQALDVLHIDRGVHIHSRPQQFLNVLIALCMAASLRIGMR